MSKVILLAEDDAFVRTYTGLVLREAGWSVLDAVNGNDAIALSHDHQGTITLLIADVNLPDMSGNEMARIIAAMRPEIKVLFLSGDLKESVVNDEAAFLQKPFTIANLHLKIKAVLDGRPPVAV